MVKITKNSTDTLFEIKGLHKFWALKSEIKIPNEHIVKAFQNEEHIKNWYALKLIGTNVPFGLHAGTFYQDGSKIFMDLVNKQNAIIVELKDENYKELIIEVEDPEIAIKLINGN